MREINIGIIGTGLLGNIHVMALNTIIEEGYFTDAAKIQITAYCDINVEHLKSYSDLNPGPKQYTNYKDLIADPNVNVIYIVTPTSNHFEQYLASAKTKKDIFIEKPLTDPPSKIQEMIRARDEADIITQVGLVLRYSPLFWYVKQLVDDPENQKTWGKLQNIIFRDSQNKPYTGKGAHPSTWRQDPKQAFHGCLFEHSIHDIDILRYWFGDINDVCAKVKFFARKEPIEDSVSAIFEMKNGASAHLTSMWHNINQDSRDFEVYFENTYINLTFEGIDGNLTINQKDSSKCTIKSKDADLKFREKMGIADHPQFWLEGYGYENIQFLKALIDRKPASPSLEDAKMAHQIVEMCYQSSKSNQLLKMP